MTDRLYSCKHSPDGKHAIDPLTKGCRYCHRTVSYPADVGWNVPAHDPDTFMAADAPYAHALKAEIEQGVELAASLWRDEDADVNDVKLGPRRETLDAFAKEETARIADIVYATMAADDAPCRAQEDEIDCCDSGPRWLCERPKGHSGQHMAWDDFPKRVLYEGGAWD